VPVSGPPPSGGASDVFCEWGERKRHEIEGERERVRRREHIGERVNEGYGRDERGQRSPPLLSWQMGPIACRMWEARMGGVGWGIGGTIGGMLCLHGLKWRCGSERQALIFRKSASGLFLNSFRVDCCFSSRGQ